MTARQGLRAATVEDAQALAEIYNYYIVDTIITFEEEPVDSTEMANRIAEVTSKFPWIVWEENSEIVGYAYANAWKSRCAYRNSVETTVYLRNGQESKGIGSQLYRELLQRLRSSGIHTAIGGIALPNVASVKLHEKCGFEKVAEFVEVGFKFGQWINVGYWQCLLRSEIEE
jgi:L-amino acid N-acyltransferase YncA